MMRGRWEMMERREPPQPACTVATEVKVVPATIVAANSVRVKRVMVIFL